MDKKTSINPEDNWKIRGKLSRTTKILQGNGMAAISKIFLNYD